jgi:hypothetical protein
MGTARRMTDHQRAAHLLLPVLAGVLSEIRAEYDAVSKEAKAAKGTKDAVADWREFRARAEGRVQGAGRIVTAIQAIARG